MTAAKRNDLNWFPHFNDSSGVPDDSPQAVPLGNIVYFMPPYAITDSETDWALEQIREVLGAA